MGLATTNRTLAERARETAHDLAERLGQADGTDFSRGFSGHAGYAIVWLALNNDDPRRAYEQQWHAAMRSGATHCANDASLGYGTAGLRAACALSIAIEPRYFNLLEKCDAHIVASLSKAFTLKHFNDIDLLSGPPGALAALAIEPRGRAELLTLRLAALCGDDAALALLHPLQEGTPVHDLGTAHGIFGLCAPVAMHADLLDSDARAMVADALRRAICEVVHIDGVATLRPWRENPAMPAAQNAWCYGVPGAASATLTAAEALGEPTLRDWALETLRTLLSCDPDRVSENAGLCHGSAGIAICLLRAAQCDERLTPMLTAYIEATIERARLGQFDMEFGGNDIYNGPPGVILALLTYAGRCTPQWLRLFAAAVPE